MKRSTNDDSFCDDCTELEKAFKTLLRKDRRRAFEWTMMKALDIIQTEPSMPVGFVAPFVGTIKTVAPLVAEQGEQDVKLPSGKVVRIRALPVDALEDLRKAPERLTLMENRLEVARFQSQFSRSFFTPPVNTTEGPRDSAQPTQGGPVDTLPLGGPAPVTGATRDVDGDVDGAPVPEGDQ